MIDDALRAVVGEAVTAAVAPLAAEIGRLREALGERERRWITRKEAAAALGCSVDSIDRRVAAGELQTQRIGKRGLRVRLPISPEASDIARLATEARRG